MNKKKWARQAFVTLALLLLLLGSLTFVAPSLARSMSKPASSNARHLTPAQPPRAHCRVIVRHGSGPQPCFQRAYPWMLDGVHPSPRILVGPEWTLRYICDGGPGSLFINGRFIQAMTCDNAWHSRTFGRGGFVQVYVDRRADVTVVG